MAIIWSMAEHRSVARYKHHQENMHSLQIKKQLHCLNLSQKPSGMIRVSPVEPARASFRSLTSVLRHRSLLLDFSVLSAVVLYLSGGHVLSDGFVFQKSTDFTIKRKEGRIRQEKAKVVFCDTFETILCFSKLYGEGNIK